MTLIRRATVRSVELSERSVTDVETVKLVVSAATGCDYCMAAHSLLGKLAGLPPDVIRNIRAGQPTSPLRPSADSQELEKCSIR
jgi:AhpD family alkylhydroperoxidase